MIKKFLSLLVLVTAMSGRAHAWSFGSGGSVDYSRDAANTFICSNPQGTPVTTQAGLSKTNPALLLVNPYGSGKNMTILETGIVPTAYPAALVDFMLAYSTSASNVAYSTGPAGSTFNTIVNSTMTTVVHALIDQTALSTNTVAAMSVGQCYRGATLPNAPIAIRYLGTISTQTVNGILDATNGRVVIPPGSSLSIQSSAAASVLAHFIWREDNQ